MAQTFQIIKNRSKFIHVREKGKFIQSKFFNLQLLEDKDLNQVIFVGFIATKKIGNAVKRNKAKRIMRELARKVIVKYGKKNFYYVLIAKNSIFNSKFTNLEIDLKKMI
tara:strand:- start:383 stop:709 length:327 start_codon:yes stop_codon:yes gene_type:complete